VKKIPLYIAKVFIDRMTKAQIDPFEQRQYLKWLRYYLDFCSKYHYSPIQNDSLQKFMLKLTEKKQTPMQQRQAYQSVRVYQDIRNKQDSSSLETSRKSPASNRYADSFQLKTDFTPEENQWESIYQKLRNEIRVRNYSEKTYQTYAGWIARFEHFVNGKNPDTIEMDDVKGFLTYLAVRRKVAASTQNQAFNAFLFLFRHLLQREDEFDAKHGIVRAKRKKYIPVVLTRQEVDRVIEKLEYPYNLVAKLLYGCGLRLFEALNIRLQSLNLDEQVLTIHDGKGLKDRSVPLPVSIMSELVSHIENLEKLYEQDLDSDYDGVFMPGAMHQKLKSGSKDLPWQWLFPAKTLTFVPETGTYKRYHLHETHVQKAIRAAVLKARLRKRVTAHTFRHTFASHLLQANYDIRTIQQMLGHSDVRTTMIYTHTVKSKTLKEQKSPLDL